MNDDPSKRGTYPAFTDPPALLEARQLAAQCWCDPETSDRVMDPAQCEAVAKRIAAAHAAGRREGLEKAAEYIEAMRLPGHADGIRALASTPTPEGPAEIPAIPKELIAELEAVTSVNELPAIISRARAWRWMQTTLFASIMGILSPDADPTDADLSRMDLIDKELRAFVEELKRDMGRT